MAEILYKNGSTEIRLGQFHSIEKQGLPFFQTNEFINRRIDSNTIFFNLYEAGKPLTSIAFEIIDDQAISLPRSPFGGLIHLEEPNEEQINKLLDTIITHFSAMQCDVLVRQCSDILYQYIPNVKEIFVRSGFKTEIIELNQHIIVDQELFRNKINRNRRRKIEACVQANFKFQKLDTSQLADAYKLIKECREDKGYPVTMSLQELMDVFEKFPNHYLLFGIMNGGELIATGISIRVNSRILYNFYHGDLLAYRDQSPVSLLVKGIYQYCQVHGYSILDLGISSDQSVLNEGLYAFKKSLGAQNSGKISYKYKN